MSYDNDDLTGCRVVIVEDEALPAMLLESMLADLGCEVVASASRLEDAVHACETTERDVVLLDVNLRGERSFDLAATLLEQHQPFVVVTGYAESVLPDNLCAVPLLRKPYRQGDLATALWDALHN